MKEAHPQDDASQYSREPSMDTTKDNKTTDSGLQIDWSNPEDARKAFIASEVFNRKY